MQYIPFIPSWCDQDSWPTARIWAAAPGDQSAGPADAPAALAEGSDATDSSASNQTPNRVRQVLDEDIEQKTGRELLGNPLNFSLRDVKCLELQIKKEELSSKELQKFHDLLGYYLSVAQQDPKLLPSRTLFAIYNTPNLNQCIPGEMKIQIQLVLDKRRGQLSQFLEKHKDIETWRHWDVSNLVAVYNHLKSGSFESAAEDDLLLTQARSMLIEYSVRLMHRYRVEHALGGEEENSKSAVFSKNEDDRLNNTEKVLLLEMRGLFPEENHWYKEDNNIVLEHLAGTVISDIVLAEPANPHFVGMWEIIDRLALGDTENDDEVLKALKDACMQPLLEAGFVVNAEIKRRTRLDFIRTQVRRSNMLKFLHFSGKNSPQVLLPEHVAILQEIQNSPEHSVLREKSSLFDWDDKAKYQELQDAISDLDKEIQEIKNQQEQLVDSYMEEHEDDEYVKKHKALSEEVTSLREQYESASEENKAQAQQAFTDKKQEAEAVRKQISQWCRQAASEDREETSNTGEGVLGNIQKLQKEIDKKYKEYGKLQRTGQEIDEIRTLTQDPCAKAEEIYKDYVKQLRGRIRNHRLHSADLQVLWSIEEGTNPDAPLEQTLTDNIEEPLTTAEQQMDFQDEKKKIMDFRSAFKDVLDKQISEKGKNLLKSEDLIDNAQDRYSTWFKNMEDVFSPEVFIKALREVYGEKDTGRIKGLSGGQEILFVQSALAYYRNDILNHVFDGGVNSEDRDSFLTNYWTRLHRKVRSLDDVKGFTAEQEIYEATEQKVLAKIEEEKKRFEDFKELTPMSDLDKHLLSDNFFTTRADKYKDGHIVQEEDEKGEVITFFVPGKESLNVACLKTVETRQDIEHLLTPMGQKLQSFLQTLRAPMDPDLAQDKIQAELQGIVNIWKDIFPFLELLLRDIKTACKGLFPASFVKYGFEPAEKFLKNIRSQMVALAKILDEDGENILTKKDQILSHTLEFGASLDQFKYFTDFRDGFWQKQSQRLDQDFEDTHKGLQVLKQHDFFEDDSEIVREGDTVSDESKREFRDNFKNLQKEFKTKFSRYEENMNRFITVVRKDINDLNEKDFFARYGFDKQMMQSLLDKHLQERASLGDMWGQFRDDSFIDSWVAKYAKSNEDRLSALQEFAHWERVTQYADAITKKSEEVEVWIQNREEQSKKKSWKVEIRFISLYDIWTVYKQVLDAQEKNWKRKSDQAVAEMGTALFGRSSRWGKEFYRLSKESEQARVKEYETQYGEQDGWDIAEALYESRDLDESRACINLLKEKGFLKWDDPRLWKTLMRLGSSVIFRIPEDMNLTYDEIRKKVRDACEQIWTSEVFRVWDQGLEGDLTKARDGYSHEFNQYEHLPEARTQVLAGMLKRWERDDPEEVDPARFEAFLYFAFENGKMNGVPDQRLFFLVKGLTLRNRWGQTILSPSILTRLNSKLLHVFPHFDFFIDKSSEKLNGRIVPDDTPGAHKGEWTYQDMLAWGDFLGDGGGSYDPRKSPAQERTAEFFYHYLHMSAFARDRASRMQRGANKNADHDDAMMFFAEWTEMEINQALVRESAGTQKNSPDFWRTFLAGFDLYMKHMKSYIEKGDNEWGNASFWMEERKRVLHEVGRRLKGATVATQTMLGNYQGLKADNRTTIFSEEDWEKDTSYSMSLDKSRNNINDFLFDLLGQAGKLDDYKDAVETKAYRYAHESDELKNKKKKVQNLLGEDTGGIFFSDEHSIEIALRNYCEQHKN